MARNFFRERFSFNLRSGPNSEHQNERSLRGLAQKHVVSSDLNLLSTIYGLNPNEFKATFEGYLELLHPDDRIRVKGIIENVLSTGEDTDFEERIVRPDGEVRYLRSWAKRKSDPNGEILGMIGACLDNTEKVSRIMAIEEQNQQFREIAWLQSHIIRAPLARIMGLIDLIKNTPVEELSQSELLDYLLTSANELDDQIRIITQKTDKR